eukprot:581971_1
MNNGNSLTSPNQLPVHQRSPSTRTQQDSCRQKKSSIGNYRSKSALQSKSLPHRPGNISVTKLAPSPLRSTKIRGIDSRMANREHRIKHEIAEKLLKVKSGSQRKVHPIKPGDRQNDTLGKPSKCGHRMLLTDSMCLAFQYHGELSCR